MIHLPNSEHMEDSIIGTIFAYPDAIYKMEQKFSAEYFYKSGNIYISKIVEELHNSGKPTSLILVHSILKERQQLQFVGDLYGLQGLLSRASRPEVLDSLVEDLRNMSIKRKTVIACSEIIANCKNYENSSDYLNFAHEKFLKLANEGPRNEIFSSEAVLKKMMDKLEERLKSPGEITGIPSGIKNLDALIGGFNNSDLIVIGARPAMGKTAFALTIAASAALDHQKLTLIFSLEMSNEQLMERMLASKCRIDSSKFRTGKIDHSDLKRLNDNVHHFKNNILHFNDKSSMNIHDISATCRRLKMERKSLNMIIIDYLQLMSSTSNKGNRERDISEITRSLKIMAKELDCPVIILSQLNRGLESRDGHRPRLSDLRESGAIEQDSDVVLLLHREEVYNKNTEDIGIAEIIVAKNRRGETDTIHCRFEGQYLSFSNL